MKKLLSLETHDSHSKTIVDVTYYNEDFYRIYTYDARFRNKCSILSQADDQNSLRQFSSQTSKIESLSLYLTETG